MNNSYTRLIDGMTTTLRQEVLTRLEDEFARGQVFGVINLLNTMRLRADWSVNFLHQQISAQREAFAKVASVLAANQPSLAAPAYPCGESPALLDSNALMALRDQGNLAIIDLLHWLWSAPAGLSTAQRSELESALRRSMRSEVEVELRHSSKPMFAEMSQGTEQK